MKLLSTLRQAAREPGSLTSGYGDGDMSEQVALVGQIVDRERCTFEYSVVQGSPGVIAVRFHRSSPTVW
jgi:hypothetical protein